MNVKTTFVLCLTLYLTKASPVGEIYDQTFEETLLTLGLSYKGLYDYNTYILNIETIVEAAQKAAIDQLDRTVDLAQEFTRAVKSLGGQEYMKYINDIQTQYFQRIEDMRHQAYDQEIDISTCAFTAVHELNKESQSAISNLTAIFTGITNTFTEYTTQNYTEPANLNLAKTYTIRERIYQCPFSFTDSLPFFTCLTKAAVLEDLVILQQFTSALNNTIDNLLKLVHTFVEAATVFSHENFENFNSTASRIYDDILTPCAQRQGFKVVLD